MKTVSRSSAALCLITFVLVSNTSVADTIEVSRGPGKTWNATETRTLDDLPKLPRDAKPGRFGGTLTGRTGRTTGFFHTNRTNGRWWLVDPEGLPYLCRGVTSIKETRTDSARKTLKQQFGSTADWATATNNLLKQNGFNGIGPWSDCDKLKPAESQLAYTKIWNFMSAYGKKRGGTFQASGHRGYPGDCPFIFDAEFPAFCNDYAKQLSETKDDPWLLGHFTDNELPWSTKMLDRYLALPAEDPGHIAAQNWIAKRKLKTPFTAQDRADFVGYAADTYFAAVCTAIRRHDPNHLILGSRFHGRALRIPQLFEESGKHLDVVSVNYYHAWTPEQERLKQWAKSAETPILITEWYAKALDSGMGNTSGAGWLVKTQADRAAFYQNFTLGLLESRACVGWHWFRYSDNDPTQKGVDPSNTDANKGIVTSHYAPYQTLLEAMRAINLRCYNLAGYFEKHDKNN